VLVEALVVQATVERLAALAFGSTKPFCIGLPGAMECHSTPVPRTKIARLVGSPLLLLTIVSGSPRPSTIVASSRTTRLPEIDVSTTLARHSRLQSSMPSSTRNRPAAGQ
jgi:hypothetical protein